MARSSATQRIDVQKKQRGASCWFTVHRYHAVVRMYFVLRHEYGVRIHMWRKSQEKRGKTENLIEAGLCTEYEVIISSCFFHPLIAVFPDLHFSSPRRIVRHHLEVLLRPASSTSPPRVRLSCPSPLALRPRLSLSQVPTTTYTRPPLRPISTFLHPSWPGTPSSRLPPLSLSSQPSFVSHPRGQGT